MKAARLHAYRAPLALDELDDPRAAGVTLSYTLGHENAGWIHEVGSAVTTLRSGTA